MNRKLLLGALVLTGAGIVGYQYLARYLEERDRRAREETVRAMIAAAKARELNPEQQAVMVARARAQIDEYQQIELARATLEQVLKANPRNAAARVELARYYIRTGHISYRNFRPGTLQRAADELDFAQRLDPKSTDAQILWGHVLYLRGQPRESVRVLQKVAESGTDNPWLHQNWADALLDLNQWEAAEVHLRKAQLQYAAAGNTPKRVVAALHSRLASALTSQQKLDEADREYQAAIALEPQDAGHRINYTDFLLFDRGMPDAALAESDRAAGAAQSFAAAARYAKWAMLKDKAPREAAEHLAIAKQLSSEFDWIMPQAAKSVGAGPAILEMVKGLMSLGVSLDTKDEHGDTGLSLAASVGNARSVVLLLKLGAQREAADNNGLTPLGAAAHKGHVEVVRLLAAAGAKVNMRDHQDQSPLNRAVTNGDVEMTRTLIALKANVNAENRRGFTPLMQAAHYGHEEVAHLLLEAGADASAAMMETRQSAADFAAARGHVKLSGMLRTAMENKVSR